MNKLALRKALKKARAEIPDLNREAEARAVTNIVLRQPEIASARKVFCYLSSPLELATDDLVNALLSRDIEVAVPLVVDQTTMLAVRFPGWDGIETGAFDIRQPRHRTPILGGIDLAITPALGFSGNGGRIGYGGGYYDRWFAEHDACLRFGIAYTCQLLDALPLDAHDKRMHRIITAAGAIECPDPDEGLHCTR